MDCIDPKYINDEFFFELFFNTMLSSCIKSVGLSGSASKSGTEIENESDLKKLHVIKFAVTGKSSDNRQSIRLLSV